MPELGPGSDEGAPSDFSSGVNDHHPPMEVEGPLELNKPRDWRYQTAVHSQTLENLQERFDRLSLQSLEQACWVEWTRVILSQPTLTFPPRWDQVFIPVA